MRRTWMPLLTVTALALAACGGGDDEPSGSGSGGGGGGGGGGGEVRQVTVGMLPVISTAGLYVGIEEGFFADRDIELSIETGQGGAALIPAVASGQMEFATSNPVSLLQARDQGLPLRVVAHWTSVYAEGEEDPNGVIVKPDSGITRAADLAGKRIAVNTLNGMGQLTIDEAIRQDGGDPSAVTYVELGFPDMPAALEAGNVDAVWIGEPFKTSLLAAGNVVASYSSKSVPGHPTTMFFTSEQLIVSDPDLVEDMTDALEDTLEYVEENPDAVRAAAVAELGVPQEVADAVMLDETGTDLRRPQIERLGELMVDAGLLEDEPDVDGLLPED
jgi:NitT/TauT family transport system substrate-binding protein